MPSLGSGQAPPAWVFYGILFTLTPSLTAIPTSSQQAGAGLAFLALSFPFMCPSYLRVVRKASP